MKANKKIKVVLIDDSALIRERVDAALSALDGVEVSGHAGDVPAGMQLLQQHQPDVLILDIGLPGETGLELLQSGKVQRESLLIIMLTNYDHPKLRERCLELGAKFYFHKLTEIEKAIDACRELAAPPVNPVVTELDRLGARVEALMEECAARLNEVQANLRGKLPRAN
jgi:DNA-binding NarL/FixJ family response regulator